MTRNHSSRRRSLPASVTLAASAAILTATVACTADPAPTQTSVSAPVPASAGAPASIEPNPGTAPATPPHDPALDDDLFAAAAADDAARVRELLARGADIEARGPHERTP